MKCKRDSDCREIDHHTLQVMRQQAVKAVKNGQTAASVAAAMGVNIRTVFRWLSDFATGGKMRCWPRRLQVARRWSHPTKCAGLPRWCGIKRPGR